MTDNRERPTPPADTHRDLMEAGYTALVEHGYADLSMRKIAAESDHSHSLLQHYYGDKQGVVVALLAFLIDGYLDDVTGGAAESDPAARLRTDLRRSLFGPPEEDTDRFWAFQTALFELRLVAREDGRVRDQFSDGEARVVARLAADVRDGVEAGVFRQVDPERVARQLRDLIDAARFRRVVMDDEAAPERAQWFVETFVIPGLSADGSDT